MSAGPDGMFAQRSPDVFHPDVLWPRPHRAAARRTAQKKLKVIWKKTAFVVQLAHMFGALFSNLTFSGLFVLDYKTSQKIVFYNKTTKFTVSILMEPE